jgi:hypothetical protein
LFETEELAELRGTCDATALQEVEDTRLKARFPCQLIDEWGLEADLGKQERGMLPAERIERDAAWQH